MVHRTSLVLLAFPRPARAQSVLTTERVDPLEVSGLRASVAAGTTLQGGNADVVKLKRNGATGYRATHSWILLVGGLSYLSSSNKVFTDDRYLQVRYGRFLSPRTRTFHFVQIQNSREQALPHRLLLGNGVRHSFVRSASTHLDLGAGVMWKSERLDASVLPCRLPLVRRPDCWSHERPQDGASDRRLLPRMLPW